jgi:recombinational DNA repair protein (RecF pathway)
MNIIDISSTVKMLLTKFKECRDNDNLLILKVWAEENPMLRDKNTSFVDFSKDFLTGKYSSPESIRRCRQKIQQEFVHLRGDLYLKRHKEQDAVKEQLKMPELNAGGTP